MELCLKSSSKSLILQSEVVKALNTEIIKYQKGSVNNTYIRENKVLLDILLRDMTTKRNIRWATSSYIDKTLNYQPEKPIRTSHVKNGEKSVIKPRITKHALEQKNRTKINAEVFTPMWVVKKQNDLIEEEFKGLELEDYVNKTWLEITCGEGPYMCSRYDMISGEPIEIHKRVGFVDRKLQRISRDIDEHNEWIKLVTLAFKSSYGYEFQGDSLFLARENVLYTFIDYYLCKFGKMPSLEYMVSIANIISYNVFQMDGLKYIVPYSDGKSVLIKDWGTDNLIKFGTSIELGGLFGLGILLKEEKLMKKFDVVIGNPPYQDGRVQIYTSFYIDALNIAENVCMIFPIGWQDAKNANSLSKMNNDAVKKDSQIVSINNLQNAFVGVTGAEWTNIIMWKKDYDNGLDGKQKITIHGKDESVKMLPIEKADIKKPHFISKLSNGVMKVQGFKSILELVSMSGPYGVRSDIWSRPDTYGLPALWDLDIPTKTLRVYTSNGLYYAPLDYPFPRITKSLNKYKVFVPKAWGNWSEENGLGGAYANIFIAYPGDVCSETYLECGAYDSKNDSEMLAKYLMTSFARGLMYVNKFSQNNARGAYQAIPLQDFLEDWWSLSVAEIDDKLFKKYNIPDDTKKLVYANIQKRDESNIIDYGPNVKEII